MTFLDFFAGVGGFRTGMEQCGHTCLGFCECDKFAIASYVSMHCITDEQREYLETFDFKTRQKEILKDEYRNGEWFADDIRRLCAWDIPVADCWCFGFPCQDISVAGKQAGFSGNRSSLFFTVTGLIRNIEPEYRPKYLFIENVKNLLSINRGFDFARLLIELDDIGYDAEWQVLNSKDFGVPQNRERVFIIGHLRGSSTTKVFPVEGSSGKNSVSVIGHRDGFRRNTQVYSPDGITETLDTGQGGGRGVHVAQFCDMNIGGLNLTDSSRTIPARYDRGVGHRTGETSGVAIQITPQEEDSEDTLAAKFCDLNYGDGLKTTENARTIQANYRIKNHSGEASGVVLNVEPVGGVNWHVKSDHQRGIFDDESRTLTATQNQGVALKVEETDESSMGEDTNEEQTDCDDVEITEDLLLDGNNFNQRKVVHGNGGVSRTIIGSGHSGTEPKVAVPVLAPNRTNKRQNGRWMKEDGDPSFTLTAQDQHGVAVAVEVEPVGGVYTHVSPEFQHGIYEDESRAVNATQTGGVALKVNGENEKVTTDHKQGIMVKVDGGYEVYAVWYEKYQCYIAIRKLTPRECFRLQGWSDEYYDRAAFVNSDSQLYKQAGNGVTVNVIYAIAKNMKVGIVENE